MKISTVVSNNRVKKELNFIKILFEIEDIKGEIFLPYIKMMTFQLFLPIASLGPDEI